MPTNNYGMGNDGLKTNLARSGGSAEEYLRKIALSDEEFAQEFGISLEAAKETKQKFTQNEIDSLNSSLC